MKNILPIASPPVYGYLHHAYPLSVLATREDYIPWFHSHYLQLYCPSYFTIKSMILDRASKLDFYIHPLYTIEHPHYTQFVSPWLDHTWIDRALLSGINSDIILFLFSCINSNRYIELSVDMFYIEKSPSYKKWHFIHEIIVYGYDNNSSSFNVQIGFGESGAFTMTKIPFEDLATAISQTNLQGHYFQRGLCLFEYIENAHFPFDLNFVLTQLKDYYHGHDSSRHFPFIYSKKKYVYGSETYKFLYDYLHFLIENPHNADIRPFHIFWEHKKCMRSHTAYMVMKDYISPDSGITQQCLTIERQAAHLRLILLRYRKNRNAQSISYVLDLLTRIQVEEKVMLDMLLSTLA